MPRKSSVVVACAAAGAVLFSQRAFVPAPKANSRAQISAAAGTIAVLGASPALAVGNAARLDEIGIAARELSKASYPFLKEVDWDTFTYMVKPGKGSAVDWLKAIDKLIVMGTAMDSELLKKAVIAHSKAIKSIDKDFVTNLDDYTEVNAAIGRIVASVPEAKVMDVYNTFDKLVPKDVAKYQMSTVNEADAKKAYEAFIKFKDVVKQNPIQPQDTTAKLSAESMRAIDDAAAKLGEASYAFAKEVDWTSDIYLKPLPGAEPLKIMNAIDRALIMGAKMDGKLLKEAGEAHHKAIGSIDAKGVASAADWDAVNAAIGKLVASVPTSVTMDVFKAFGSITDGNVPSNMFSKVNPVDALSAYNGLMAFKDVVKVSTN